MSSSVIRIDDRLKQELDDLRHRTGKSYNLILRELLMRRGDEAFWRRVKGQIARRHNSAGRRRGLAAERAVLEGSLRDGLA